MFTYWMICAILLVIQHPVIAQTHSFHTEYVTIDINKQGFITSIKDNASHKEYCPSGNSSALLSLYKNEGYILPFSARFNIAKNQIVLSYPNGSVATVKAEEKGKYLRFKLLSLSPRNGVDNIVWGPYKTSISKTIGEIISVVRNNDYAIGIMALDDNTTSGPPCDGDMNELFYYIHSPDPKLYPLPANLSEGQKFPIGGDGISDIAFFSHPEEYYRMNSGNGASLEPSFGSTITLHARDRRKPQTIFYTLLPGFVGVNSPRHQVVAPVDADFMGSAIAFYGCPDTLGLHVIENIVLAEGLPHPEINGKWIKDPAAYRPDIAWWGVHDSLISYARQLNFKAVQDEGLGEYYPNPADRWANKKINFSNGSISIKEYTDQTNREGIAYGLHTLCEFIQPHSSDVSPLPNDSLCTMLSTTVTKEIQPTDTIITVADTSYLNEFGGWEGNHTNVLKIGKELITYSGVTKTKPYTLLNIKRGSYSTPVTIHKKGEVIVKLQPNCYRGFVPDMRLQDKYAEYYAHLLKDGGMNYIDFDGLESCMYQGHGQYSFKKFFRKLFTTLNQLGVPYLRVMGSTVAEGNWHYMSICNVGGGNNMFNPATNKWGIEGKDIRYGFLSNYLPCTFGIVDLHSDWTAAVAENLQAKSIGWGATYMLGISQNEVEKCGEKYEIFNAIKTWENARIANVFTANHRKKLSVMENKYHLEQLDQKTFNLYPVQEVNTVVGISDNMSHFTIKNPYFSQSFEFAMQITGEKDASISNITIQLNSGKVIKITTPVRSGQYIVCKRNKIYVTDHNRQKVSNIDLNDIPLMGVGENEIKITVGSFNDSSLKLNLLFSMIGVPEKLGS